MTTIKPGAGRPTAERAAAIDAALVEATLDAFAADGSDFNVDQVAARAGVSKQAIYRRWKTKEELLVHAISSLLTQRINTATEDLPDNPFTALRAVAWRLFDRDNGRDHRIGIFIKAQALRDEGLQQHLHEWGEQFGAPYRRLAQPIAARAGVPVEMVEVNIDILIEMLDGATSRLAMLGLQSDADKRRVFDQRWDAFVRMAESTPKQGCETR
ncbi:TetR/AcrR family transcriptional regulator [Polymorphobacter sp.]|uniref:TetR/AcrR family transcriptional regulator n=1 Tax=Polymorphobacter sp. TaxID=1909290 RepID=UPI003F725CAF